MHTESNLLTPKKLFYLWLPLALMWIVMAVEQPAITAIISRLPNPTIQLAAFGYAFALALLIEGPIIQMLSAGTAITKDIVSYKRLVTILHLLAIGITSVHLIVCIPSVYNWIALSVMGIPDELLKPSYWTFLAMIPWAAAVGYRRLWQGVMIRYGKTRAVPVIMYIRILTAAAVLGFGLIVKSIPGGLLGGLALSFGVTVGAVSAGIFVRPIIKSLPVGDPDDPAMPIGEMVKFYIPLALTSLINLGVRPLLNFGIARGLFPLESLAVWPVALSYMFIYTSISSSMQEIVIAQQRNSQTLAVIQTFIRRVGGILFMLSLVFLVSKAWKIWFVNVSGLPAELLRFLPLTLTVLIPLPFIYSYISLFRGLLVISRKTRIITQGVILNVVIMLVVITLCAQVFGLPGVYAAAIAFTSAYVCESLFLFFRGRSY